MPTLRPQVEDAVVLPVREYDAVLFDMDGVITDTAEVHRQAWAAMFDGYLHESQIRTGRLQPPFGLEDYQRYVDGKHRDDGVRDFLASRGIHLAEGTPEDSGGETVWGLANRKNDAFRATLARSGARVFPSSVDLVRALQSHGVGTAVISASRNCQRVLDAAGIGDLFAVRVDGGESARLGLPGKPDPAMFQEAARRLGAEPGRSMVVEDAVAGVQAGRAGHFGLVVGVDRGGHAVELRRAGADVVVADLAAIHPTA
jgi:alpha,alpha-trehalase